MTNNTPDHMTGAELQTLREACGLSREELATVAHVQARTIKHWENGRSGVPADVAALVQVLDQAIEQEAKRLADQPHPLGPLLVRYSTSEDQVRYSLGKIFILFGTHSAAIGRARQMLRAKGGNVRVVWMYPEAYEAWHKTSRAAEPLNSYRMQYLWAVEQVSAQANPFKSDQPPAAQ